jgi:uncharacterized protein YcnI
MRHSRILAAVCASTMLIYSSFAAAHVTVRPAEAAPGATTTYTVRVPTEGQTATTSVELDVPPGVTIVTVAGEPGSYEMMKTGERVTMIMWKTSIPPGERAELNFTAQNPANGAEIVWKAHQHFQDGSRADWVEAKGSKRPSSITVLKAAP